MPALSVACTREEKSRWRQLSAKLGYPGSRFSQFVRLFLNAAAGKYDQETWEARTLYLSEGRIGVQSDGPDSVAFRVVGPGHFWRYVDREADRVAAGSGSRRDP